MRGINFGLDALGRGGRNNAVTPWWLAGGVSPSECVAAYQAKGASSLSDSYKNLNNPGVNNALVGVAPAWDGVNGWLMNGGKYLYGPELNSWNNASVIVRYTNATSSSNRIFGVAYNGDNNPRFFLLPLFGNYLRFQYGNQLVLTSISLTSGIAALCGCKAYFNGGYLGSSDPTWTTQYACKLGIGGQASSAGGANNIGISANISALAVYNRELSSLEVSAITNAMNAL